MLLSTDNSVTTNANDVEIGSFEFKRTMTTALGTNVPVRIKAVVFRAVTLSLPGGDRAENGSFGSEFGMAPAVISCAFRVYY